MSAKRLGRATFVGPVVAVLMASACSGSGKSATPATTAPVSSTTLDPATARARSALITTADLPQGWRSFALHPIDTGPTAGPAQGLSTCLGVDASLFRHNRTGHVFVLSPLFEGQDFTSVTQSLDVAPSTAAARADFALVAHAGFPACLAQAMGTVMADEERAQIGGIVTSTVAHSALLAFPAFGDRSAAFRGNVTVTQRGQPGYVYVDIIVIQVGATTSILQFEHVFSPADPSLERDLAAAVVRRMRA